MRVPALALAVLALLVAGCSRPAGGPPAAASASADPGRPLPSPMPDVLARVNGQPIDIRQVLPMAKAEIDTVSVAERDRKKPEIVRRALQKYVDRELLLQEALARGIEVDARAVDWDYDQMRRDHSDEAAWAQFLAEEGMDARSLRAELRTRHLVAALLEQERKAPASAGRDAAAVRADLLARLRAKARIELLL
jgi:hypothetical protein